MRTEILASLVLVVAVASREAAGLPAALGGVLALPLVALLPGYAVLRTLAEPLPQLERLVLSVGLSLSITVVTGLALNALGALTPLGWTSALGAISVTGFFFGRRTKAESPQRRAHAQLTWRQFAMIAASGLLVLAALVGARIGFLAHRQFTFTEFWIVPASPTGEPEYVIGVANHEATDASYDVEVHVDGELFAQWSAIELAKGQTWTQEITLPVKDSFPRMQRAEALLFKSTGEGEAELHRKVWAEYEPMERSPAPHLASHDDQLEVPSDGEEADSDVSDVRGIPVPTRSQ